MISVLYLPAINRNHFPTPASAIGMVFDLFETARKLIDAHRVGSLLYHFDWKTGKKCKERF